MPNYNPKNQFKKGHPGHSRTHGGVGTPEYTVWQNMLARCERASHPEFHNYGGRGISVCAQWKVSFETFLHDVGRRPSKAHSLDRHPNNDGHYEPGNVRWATKPEQARNTRVARWYELNGERMVLADWAKTLGIKRHTLYQRLKRYPPEVALTMKRIASADHSSKRSNKNAGAQRDEKYLAWIRTLPCELWPRVGTMCKGITEAHHAGDHGFAQRPPDRTAIPLCGWHHRLSHDAAHGPLGRHFWAHHNLDRDSIIKQLNERYNQLNA